MKQLCIWLIIVATGLNLGQAPPKPAVPVAGTGVVKATSPASKPGGIRPLDRLPFGKAVELFGESEKATGVAGVTSVAAVRGLPPADAIGKSITIQRFLLTGEDAGNCLAYLYQRFVAVWYLYGADGVARSERRVELLQGLVVEYPGQGYEGMLADAQADLVFYRGIADVWQPRAYGLAYAILAWPLDLPDTSSPDGSGSFAVTMLEKTLAAAELKGQKRVFSAVDAERLKRAADAVNALVRN